MHSRERTRYFLGLLLVGLLAGCGQMQPMGAHSDMIDHQVRHGDTLYSIAWRYGYDPREVAAWNNIPAPYTIVPGQHIYIIPPYQKNARNNLPRNRVASGGYSAGSASTPASSSISHSSVGAGASQTTHHKVEKSHSRLHNKTVTWQWPTAGKLVTRFSPSAGKKGVDIRGKIGQPVKAAAAGKVVYSGNGLIGYGNLIIVKHNETYLSAYGHNRRLLVKEGEVVKQGEKIAEMGDSGKEGVLLHFEIRRDGKPVNPLRYLPKNGS